MAREDVNIKVSADVAQAIQMWKAMEDGPQAMANQIDSMSSRGRKGARDMTADFDKLIGKWASIATGIAAAKAALDIYIEAKERLNDLENENTLTVDESARRLFVQGTVTGAEEQSRLRQQVLRVAQNRATEGGTAFQSATQLVSSGFAMDEVVNQGGLDEFLKILNTTNASGAETSPDQLAKALVQYMTASGQQLTTANLKSTGVAIQSLFRGTNLQIGGLARFAPEAATISKYAGLSGNEMAAIYSQFLDVDFQGESFEEVRRRLAGAMGGVSGEQRNVLMKQLFGQDGLTFANVLLSGESIAETRRRVGLTEDQAGFDATLGIAESGVTAERRRTEALEQQAFFAEDKVLTTEDYRRRLDATNRLGGDGGWDMWWKSFAFERARNFTDDRGAAGWGTSGGAEFLERPPALTPDEAGVLGYGPNSLQDLRGNSPRSEFLRGELRREGIDVTITLRDTAGNEIPQDAEVHGLNDQGGS